MADTRRHVEAVNWAALADFTVTEEHLKLLQHVYLDWIYGEGYGAPAINSKRPYGDSYVERSIAEILDAPDGDWVWEDGIKAYPTPEAEERFTRLHVETMIVLHIVLAARDIRPGRYIRDDIIGWVRVDEEDADQPWPIRNLHAHVRKVNVSHLARHHRYLQGRAHISPCVPGQDHVLPGSKIIEPEPLILADTLPRHDHGRVHHLVDPMASRLPTRLTG